MTKLELTNQNTKNKYNLAHKDYMEIEDMDNSDLMKYSKKQLATAVAQLANELHESECSKCDQ